MIALSANISQSMSHKHYMLSVIRAICIEQKEYHESRRGNIRKKGANDLCMCENTIKGQRDGSVRKALAAKKVAKRLTT